MACVSKTLSASLLIFLVAAATVQAMLGGLGGLPYNGYGFGDYGLKGLGYGGKGYGSRGYNAGGKSFDRGYSYARGHDSGKAYGDAALDMGGKGAGGKGLGRRGAFGVGQGFVPVPFIY